MIRDAVAERIKRFGPRDCRFASPSVSNTCSETFYTKLMRNALALVFILIAIHSVLAQDIKVEYNPKEDFTGFKRYTWLTQEQYPHPLLALHIMGAIDEQLQAKGLKRVEGNGELIVAAYGAIDSDLNVAYRPEVYSMPGLTGPVWWANGQWIPGGSSAVYIKKGTLVIDIADPREKRLKWRGIARMTLDSQEQDKNFERVNKAVEKMFQKFP